MDMKRKRREKMRVMPAAASMCSVRVMLALQGLYVLSCAHPSH
jgi:hypothetical protein